MVDAYEVVKLLLATYPSDHHHEETKLCGAEREGIEVGHGQLKRQKNVEINSRLTSRRQLMILRVKRDQSRRDWTNEPQQTWGENQEDKLTAPRSK